MPKMDIQRLLKILYQPYKFLIFAPFLGIWTTLCTAGVIAAAAFSGPRTGNIIGKWWARLIAVATPIWVRCQGLDIIDPHRSYVVVSNHQSQYDIIVLYGWLGIDFKWVMKQELRRIPAIGISCERLGHIFIDRSDHAAAMASLQMAREKIRNGTSIVFFPEGTRSPQKEMLPFKKGAFRMALDLNLPLLPVSISGSRQVLPTRTIDIFPGPVTLTIHPPIDTAAYGEQQLTELMADTRRVIESALD